MLRNNSVFSDSVPKILLFGVGRWITQAPVFFGDKKIIISMKWQDKMVD